MTSTNRIDNLLEETINRFFTLDTDTSFNYLQSWINIPTVPPPTYDNVNDDDSIPDLIDPDPDPDPVLPPVSNPLSIDSRGIQLWGNVVNDYNTQMRMYQENIQSILDITRNFLPQRSINPPTRTNNTTNPSIWRDLVRNNQYSIEIERILPSLFSTNVPTTNQIASSTIEFICDFSNNPINYQVCPISLEDFHDGESLTRILHCGHIFKTGELTRWFTRNSHCPTCRYDIRPNR